MAEEMFQPDKVFYSKAEVEKIVEEYEKASNCKLRKRSTKTFKAVKIFVGPFNPNLQEIFEIKYVCELEGTFKSRGEGKRTRQSKKCGCKFHIVFRATNKQYYTIVSMCLKHDHSKSTNFQPPTVNPLDDNASDDLSHVIQDLKACLATEEHPSQEEKIENIRELMSIWADNQSVTIKAVPRRDESSYSIEPPQDDVAAESNLTSHEESLNLSDSYNFAHSSAVWQGPNMIVMQSESERYDTDTFDTTTEDIEASIPKVTIRESTAKKPGRPKKRKTKQKRTSQTAATTPNKKINDDCNQEQRKRKCKTPETATASKKTKVDTGNVKSATGGPKSKCKPFQLLTVNQQRKLILEWLVGKRRATQILKGQKLNLQEVDFKDLRDSVADECVQFNIISEHCDDDVMVDCLVQAAAAKRRGKKFSCGTCGKKMNKCIKCEGCLVRYHYECEGFEKAEKVKESWFCTKCKH